MHFIYDQNIAEIHQKVVQLSLCYMKGQKRTYSLKMIDMPLLEVIFSLVNHI